MEKQAKRAKFFRNIVANSMIFGIVLGLVLFIAFQASAAVTVSEPINRGSKENTISLMVSVTRNSESLDKILNTLDELDIKATFFVSGFWVAENNEAAKRMVERGHELGNQGFFSHNQSTLYRDRIREEIDLTHRLVKRVTGENMFLYSPLSGAWSTSSLPVIEEMGYKMVIPSREGIRNETEITSGEIILLQQTNDEMAALVQNLTILRERFTFAPIGEVIYLTA